VVGVMKRSGRSTSLLKFLNDLLVGHGLLQFLADVCALPAITAHVPAA
jgi:hypothetical protein